MVFYSIITLSKVIKTEWVETQLQIDVLSQWNMLVYENEL